MHERSKTWTCRSEARITPVHLHFAQLCEDGAEREMYVIDRSLCAGERACNG
jgi:hypothetical protein